MSDYLFIPNYNEDFPSGVYAIMNIASYRWYIGSTINFTNRADRHFNELEQGIHHNRNLQLDFDLYGPRVFSFIVLERCSVVRLEEREQVWLNRLGHRAYNIRMKIIRPESIYRQLHQGAFIRR